MIATDIAPIRNRPATSETQMSSASAPGVDDLAHRPREAPSFPSLAAASTPVGAPAARRRVPSQHRPATMTTVITTGPPAPPPKSSVIP